MLAMNAHRVLFLFALFPLICVLLPAEDIQITPEQTFLFLSIFFYYYLAKSKEVCLKDTIEEETVFKRWT